MLPLSVLANWHEHLRSTSATPTPQQLHLDSRLPAWWNRFTSLWTRPVAPLGPAPHHLALSIPEYPDRPVLGLYHVSPRGESSASTTSSITLPTPLSIHSRYVPQLPTIPPLAPIRNRAYSAATIHTQSTTSPSSSAHGHRHVISAGGMSDFAPPSSSFDHHPAHANTLPPLKWSSGVTKMEHDESEPGLRSSSMAREPIGIAALMDSERSPRSH